MTVVSHSRVAKNAQGSDAEALHELGAAGTLWVMLAFVILSPLLSSDTASGGQGNLARQMVYLAIFGSALICAQVLQYPGKLLSLPRGIAVMLVWSCASVTWAIDPGVGARRLLLTIIVIYSIFLLVQRAGYSKSVDVVRILLPLILCANYAAVAIKPEFAIHLSATTEDPSIVGAWRGIMTQKNFAGAACAYTILFFALDSKQVRPLVRTLIIVAAAFFLYQTHSKTSLGFVAISILAAGAFTLYNPRYRIIALVFLFLGLSILIFLTYLNWDWLTSPFSREDFLTGRVQIWPVLIRFWKDHWLLGSGYGSFWNVHNPQPIFQYTKGWIAGITSGHNGFIDILVQTGLPGFVFTVAATVVAPARVFVTNLQLSRSRGSLLVACIVFSICHNLTESSVFDRDATVNVFLMLSLALLGIESRPGRPVVVRNELHA